MPSSSLQSCGCLRLVDVFFFFDTSMVPTHMLRAKYQLPNLCLLFIWHEVFSAWTRISCALEDVINELEKNCVFFLKNHRNLFACRKLIAQASGGLHSEFVVSLGLGMNMSKLCILSTSNAPTDKIRPSLYPVDQLCVFVVF